MRTIRGSSKHKDRDHRRVMVWTRLLWLREYYNSQLRDEEMAELEVKVTHTH